jgi:hypothetical protein
LAQGVVFGLAWKVTIHDPVKKQVDGYYKK